LYAYLQDDVSHRRPSVDLALNLLASSAAEKLAFRARFGSDAPLIAHALVSLIPDPNQTRPPLLAHDLKLDDQVVAFLLGEVALDKRLADICELRWSTGQTKDDPALAKETSKALAAIASRAAGKPQAAFFHFQGPNAPAKQDAARSLAERLGVPLLNVDLRRLADSATDFDARLRLAVREAWLKNAVLCLDGIDALRDEAPAAHFQQLMTQMAKAQGIVISTGAGAWVPHSDGPCGVAAIDFPLPNVEMRRLLWQESLAETGVSLEPQQLDQLAGRFRLNRLQIRDAAVTARNCLGFEGEAPPADPLRHCFAAARAQTGQALGKLTLKIAPKYTWDDLVLPDDAAQQLREICRQVAHRHKVLGEWGFVRRLSLGKGVSALFAGPSGTGKTMAAEVIANALGLDLHRIDLAGVVSKYIGETEKNLDRIFSAAENANAILFFDEADALFGKRSEVHDAHDRYANIEISYLLQKMEQYEGVAILASNLKSNLDEAFVRRLAFIVHFPPPDEAARRRIWAGIWPPALPLAPDVDLDFLARQFKLSGGQIKNIALAAAFLSTEDAIAVTPHHVMQAVLREYQKMGKQLTAAELGLSAKSETGRAV